VWKWRMNLLRGLSRVYLCRMQRNRSMIWIDFITLTKNPMCLNLWFMECASYMLLFRRERHLAHWVGIFLMGLINRIWLSVWDKFLIISRNMIKYPTKLFII
jgi:hypothetical protein